MIKEFLCKIGIHWMEIIKAILQIVYLERMSPLQHVHVTDTGW